MDGPNRWVSHEESRRSRSSSHIFRRRNVKICIQIAIPRTNNETKYETLLIRLSLAKALGTKSFIIQVDSQLIIGQVKGDYEVKEERMQKYLKIVQ